MCYSIPEVVANHQLYQKWFEKMGALGLAVDDYLYLKNKIMSNDITSESISYAADKKCSLREAEDRQYWRIMELELEARRLMYAINAEQTLCTDSLTAYMTAAFKPVYSLQNLLYLLKYQLKDGIFRCDRWDAFMADNKSNASLNAFEFLGINV